LDALLDYFRRVNLLDMGASKSHYGTYDREEIQCPGVVLLRYAARSHFHSLPALIPLTDRTMEYHLQEDRTMEYHLQEDRTMEYHVTHVPDELPPSYEYEFTDLFQSARIEYNNLHYEFPPSYETIRRDEFRLEVSQEINAEILSKLA